jgi:pimeloyl-ACP methyl ester carboxylesterase
VIDLKLRFLWESIQEGRKRVPYASSGVVRINYRVEGSGPPLVLQTGFSDSLESWYELGYVAPLSKDYRLILIDARGHGDSDKPHEPEAYSPTHMVGDVVSVLDACDVAETHFYGYSMGGSIGLAMAKLHPERLRSLVAGGACPADDSFPEEVGEQMVTLAQKGAEAFIEVWETQAPISDELKNRLLANDMVALQAAQQNQDFLSVEDVPLSFGEPFLMIMGDQDWSYPAMAKFADRLEPGVLVTLPGLNHLEAFLHSDLVVPVLTRFLTEGAPHP